MSIDKERIAAVELLRSMGFVFKEGRWQSGAVPSTPALIAAADAMHSELVGQCDDLMGCPEDCPEGDELERLTGLVQAYEAARPRD